MGPLVRYIGGECGLVLMLSLVASSLIFILHNCAFGSLYSKTFLRAVIQPVNIH